jgi:hypothetical protein
MPMVVHTKIKSKSPKIKLKKDDTYLDFLEEGGRVKPKPEYILTHHI